MNDPIQGCPAGQENLPEAPPGSASGALSRQGRGTVLSAPIMKLRQLHYYLELLSAGYRQAIHPDASSRSLRGERIALGIDLPELDTVPLWASRRPDGAVSIPFVEFILDQISRSLDGVGGGADGGLETEMEALAAARHEIEALVETATPKDEPVSTLPRLRDVYLPEGILNRLCGPDGLTGRIIQHCTEVVLAAAGGRDH